MIHGPSDIHRYSYNPVRDAAIKFGIEFSCAYKEEKEKAEKEKEATKEISQKKTKSNAKTTITSTTNKNVVSKKVNKKTIKRIKIAVESLNIRRSVRLSK